MRVGGIEVVFKWEPPSIPMEVCLSVLGGSVPWLRYRTLVRPQPTSVDHHGRPVTMPDGEYWQIEHDRLVAEFLRSTTIVEREPDRGSTRVARSELDLLRQRRDWLDREISALATRLDDEQSARARGWRP